MTIQEIYDKLKGGDDSTLEQDIAQITNREIAELLDMLKTDRENYRKVLAITIKRK